MFSIDPGLLELAATGGPDDEIMAIVRLHDAAHVPGRIRVIARFGAIVTCRVRRRDVVVVHSDPAVASMKAASPVIPDVFDEAVAGDDQLVTDVRRPDVPQTGRDVVYASIDWGFDFAHPNFRAADGKTRVLALWDQSAPYDGNRYGYGTIHDRAAIDAALGTSDPYAALGYDPRRSDPRNVGTHATHVVDIGAGNGFGCGPAGIAPEAHIIFVHLAQGLGPTQLGDSATLLEGVDFIVHTAGDLPWVLSLSMGNMGGPHDSSTLVERAFDELLQTGCGRAIAQSCGNYYARMAHTRGTLRTGEHTGLLWQSDRAALTPNELEIWYSGDDRFTVALSAPDGTTSPRAALGTIVPMNCDGRMVAQIYHRPHDPNNGDNHVHIYLYPGFQPGLWQVHVTAEHARSGRYDAWIERDEECSGCQSRFAPDQAVRLTTTGTICHAHQVVAVGAYDAHQIDFEPASFSSSGPTRDGREIPVIVAPGVGVLAARSAPLDAQAGAAECIRKSGTSMSSPHAAGAMALLLEAAPTLTAGELHALLLDTADREGIAPEYCERAGNGRLDIEAALAAVPSQRTQETIMTQTAPSETLVGQASIGSTLVTVNTTTSIPAYSSDSLDDALQYALSQTTRNSVITGRLLGGRQFDVYHFNANILPADDVIDFDAQADACALLFSGLVSVFVPSDPVAATRRWVRLPRADEFYALSDGDRAAQRATWITKIVSAHPPIEIRGAALTKEMLRKFSMVELRLLLAHFAGRCFRVLRQDKTGAHGALVNGVTLPLMISPVREPNVYVRVIAGREGRLEAINAWDQGAGISLGAVQINVIRGLLFQFLAQFSVRDSGLFRDAIGSPLGWSIRDEGDHSDLDTTTGVTLHGRAAEADVRRNFAFLQSGSPDTPDGSAIDVDLRVRFATAFRDAVVWPHVQEFLNDAATAYLQPGLDAITAAGIAALDPANPDRDTFILKALLLAAYVRASASLRPILDALSPFAPARDKLAALTPTLVETALRPVIHSHTIRQEIIARIIALGPNALAALNTVRHVLSLPAIEASSDGEALYAQPAARETVQEIDESAIPQMTDRARAHVIEAPHAAELFDAFHPSLASSGKKGFAELFEMIAPPLSRLESVQAGDVVVRRVLGSSRGGAAGIITEDTALSAPSQYASLTPLRDPYEPAVPVRITNRNGRMPADTLVLRPREMVEAAPEDIDSSGLTWAGASPDQLSFMRAVYDQHVSNSQASGRIFIADVPQSERDAAGNGQTMRTEAARSCRDMLAAARSALASAKGAGDSGAADILNIRINSGYRSASRQFGIWQRNFPKIYAKTAAHRAGLPGGEHGSDAIAYTARYMGRWVAAPGYSNHNDGRAADIGADRASGSALGADSNDAAIAAWRSSWLFSWLSSNAATYNFYQNTSINEPWHWEYRAQGVPTQSVTEAAGTAAGSTYVSNTPLLSSHTGTQPDLYICWNSMTTIPQSVDVVVHLHGFSSDLGSMLLSTEVGRSGLDFSDPAGSGTGRTAPSVGIIPRGHYDPSPQRADRYTFPALLPAGAINDLITNGLAQFASAAGAGTTVTCGRFVLTCHSGGGNPLNTILGHIDPDEIHLFDAMYYTPPALLAWITRHIASDDAASAGTSALRMFFTGGASTTGHANEIATRVRRDLRAATNTSALAPYFRVERTSVPHIPIPHTYGWRLLADASADVPKTTRILPP